MLRGVAIGTSQMIAQGLRLEVLASNLAHVDTPGYRRDQLTEQTFARLLVDRIARDQATIGQLELGPVQSRPTIDLTPGPVEGTDRPLDVAIVGPGFFAVESPDGVQYTRRGAFRQTADGQLVSLEGWPVLGQNGPIAAAEPLRILPTGEVYAGDQRIDQLQIVTFAPDAVLERREGVYLVPAEGGGAEPVGTPQVLPGHLEGSNVDLASTMTELLAASRAYQAAQRAVVSHDDALERLIQKSGQA